MRVLITGGSGFLGRSILKFWPENEYVVYSRSESAQARCQEKYPDAVYVLGDIRDLGLLERTIRAYNVEGIVHTAGIKRVQEAEANVWETVEVNVDGSRNVASAASHCGVSVAVAISTDKAVRPSTVYGMTKALMERLWREMARAHAGGMPRYVVVRNGNFVGSTGSVIETWRRRIADGKPIELTDPSMTRFWQSPEESVRLIRSAFESDSGCCLMPTELPAIGGKFNGQVVARSMKMGDLALLVAGGQGDLIHRTQPRVGDKMHERFTEGGWTSGESLTIPDEEMAAMIEQAESV